MYIVMNLTNTRGYGASPEREETHASLGFKIGVLLVELGSFKELSTRVLIGSSSIQYVITTETIMIYSSTSIYHHGAQCRTSMSYHMSIRSCSCSCAQHGLQKMLRIRLFRRNIHLNSILLQIIQRRRTYTSNLEPMLGTCLQILHNLSSS